MTTRPRILAVACWDFPIYSQTFVYQELTQLIRRGCPLQFAYAREQSRAFLPDQFEPLWGARRRVPYEDSPPLADLDHFERRMPQKVGRLIEILVEESGISAERLRQIPQFGHAFTFTRAAEAYRPDYLHSYFFYEGTLFAFVASYLLDIPRGVSCYADHMLKDYELKLVPLHLNQCSLVVATSARIKRELVRIAPDADPAKIVVKPNGINTNSFPAVQRQDPVPGQPFRLVCLSRIEPKKGLLDLVAATRCLRDRYIPVEVHLVGDVDDSPSSREYVSLLTRQIEALGLGDIVHREGFRNEAEINRLFAASHLFVAPFVETERGDKDGIPTALLEGMASGLPVVATDAGSICEVVEHGRQGVIVPQRDPQALADAIEAVLADPDRRAEFSRQSVRTVQARFDANLCEGVLHERVLDLVGGRQARSVLECGEP
jgi:glycosyltransferase involved in cell wall biosynthesis